MSATLTDGPVRNRLFDLWVPMIGGVLAVKAIGLSDAYFVGQLGEQPLAAISFTFPIVMTLVSLAIGLSAGASSVLSRAIGEDEDRSSQQAIVLGALVMAAIVAAALSVFGLLLIGPLLQLMGATGENLSDARVYMTIWFSGSLFLVVPIAINGLLRATGDGVSPALLMSIIAVVNIALNPVFIFGFGAIDGFGMQGAAAATIVARGLAMIGAIALLSHKGLLKLDARLLFQGLKRWQEITRIGLPASFSTSLSPMALSIATAAVATLGSAEVAAFGVVTKIQSFAVVPLLALSSASAPLIGQNSGANEINRSRRALIWCGAISVFWSILIAIGLFFGGEWLVSMFTESKAVTEAAALYLMIVPLTYAGYGIVISLSAGLNGLGRSVQALAISGGRAMLLLTPAAYVGVLLGGFLGLAIGTALANLTSGLIAWLVVFRNDLTAHKSEDASFPDASECD